MAAAIDLCPEFDPAEKSLLNNFAEQAVVSPRCARLIEHFNVQFRRVDRTKKFITEVESTYYLVFRSRYNDARGRAREVCVFRGRYSTFREYSQSGVAPYTVVIMDERGRVLSWKENGEIPFFDSVTLECACKRIILKIFTAESPLGTAYRCDLAGDDIQPIRVEPLPDRKFLHVLAEIERRGGQVSCGQELEVRFRKGELADDDLAALTDVWDTIGTIGGVRTLYLARSRITGAGLRHLKNLTTLNRLALGYTAVDDSGLSISPA